MTVELENNEKAEENKEKPENPDEIANQKPKTVDAPYYIKVNYQANVVTVYKKDKSRKIYSTNKDNDMFVSERRHQLQEYTELRINILGDY